MKRFLFVVGACLFLTVPLLAFDSVGFTTKEGFETSWILSYDGGWELSFIHDTVVVDETSPSDGAVGMWLTLPTMSVTSLTDLGGVWGATLVPQDQLIIHDNDIGHTQVLAADVANGGTVIFHTTYAAFDLPADDLDITDIDLGVSSALDSLYSEELAGGWLDLRFVATVYGGETDLYELLGGTTGTAQGNLAGSITGIPPIPAPGAMLLGGLGAGLVGWMRRRHTL